ncbi:uncharacterized protein [Magallana gigas]|uniref:uncharacterized protein n=1 Tax=Magallana gigas TaxID=29159 RepID=UPI00333EAC5C
MCGEWLSLKFKDGKTYRTLVPATPQIINGQVVFTELSLRGFFDDHLWFSISKRPNYSRFTRVQRMWSLVALLFLSMVTSAMWYNSEPSEEKQITTGTVQRSVTLGPFKLNLKQIYVGLMSSIITVIPSIIIISLFRNRKLKTDSSEDIRRTGGKLPWWTIFIAYFLIVAAIVGGGFFTFLYSLQFGYGKTNDWLLSFVFGTAEGAFMMDPLKVLFVATLFGICCKKSTNVLSECAEENHLKTAYVSDYIKRREIAYYPCPNTAVDQEKINKQRKEVQLDSKLKKISKSWVLTFLYIFLLAIICAHNTVTEAFRQNSYLKSSIKDSFLANTTDDIYLWMQRYMLTQIWPKWYSNLALRTAYEQRFNNDEYSYRISKSTLRQVRSHNCSPLEEMKSSVSKCTSDYSIETEDKTNYCKGWLPFQTENTTCYDEYDPIDNSFIYQSAEVTNTLTYIGEFAMYGGGGYTIDLGPKQSLVEQYIENLKNLSWIDGKTRAVFFETNTFNANTRLFSHLKIVFEISEYGSIYMTTRVKSLNLYPYVTSMDYIILGCQLIFVFIIIMRIVFFAVYIFKKRSACFRTFSSWIIALDLFLSLIAVIFYILRIDTTIKAINDIIESRGSYVSLEHVELYDMVYRTALGLVFFFGILRLLQPLTINYHFFILQKSLAKARYDIFMSMILIIFALVSFGSYLFLSLGRYSENFKDLYSSIISLLRMLLAMISFRLNPNLDSVESRIVTGLFFFSISIIGVNLFIAILFGHFADVHAMQSKLKSKTGNEVLDDEVFNFELNDHLWKQMKRIKHIFSEPKIESQGISFPEDILHKLEILNQHVTLKCKDEYRFMRVIPCLVYLTNAMSWSMYMAMKTAADYSEENGLRYRFFNPNEDHPRLTVHFPEANLSDAPDIQCNNVAHRYFSLSSEIRRLLLFAKTRIYEFKLPNDRPFQMKVNDITKRITIIEVDDELVSDEDYLVCSFDDRQSWFRYAIRPREDKFCCTLPKLPTYCFVIGKLGQIQVNRDTICCFPDIEYHQIRKEGNSIFLHADKRIRLSFPPGSVQNNCDIYVMMDLPKKQICPFVHVLVKEDINDPVEISLPIVYKGLQASKYGHKNTEKLIVVREGEKEWMVLNSVLKLDAAGFTFETIKIQSNVPTTFGLKEAVLPWVENPFDKLDTKILKTINMVSRYNCVALKWSEIAHNLDIEFPSTFGERETDSYEICNNETTNENPNPRQMRFTFRRVIDIPISAQEKCLYIFSAWYRMYPLGIVVSSFRKVLEDCNLHFIADQLGQRL